MDLVLTVIGVLAGALVVVVALGLVRLLLLRRRHRARVAALSPELVTQAALFGVASDRTTQTRGVGSLVLGAEQLAFVTVVAGRDVTVPRAAITSATAPRTFMGRRSDADLLVVTWERDGDADAAAFRVSDPHTWLQRLS